MSQIYNNYSTPTDAFSQCAVWKRIRHVRKQYVSELRAGVGGCSVEQRQRERVRGDSGQPSRSISAVDVYRIGRNLSAANTEKTVGSALLPTTSPTVPAGTPGPVRPGPARPAT